MMWRWEGLLYFLFLLNFSDFVFVIEHACAAGPRSANERACTGGEKA